MNQNKKAMVLDICNVLNNKGIEYVVQPNGYHLVVSNMGNTYDVYPSTGKWANRGDGVGGTSMVGFLKELRLVGEPKKYTEDEYANVLALATLIADGKPGEELYAVSVEEIRTLTAQLDKA